MGDSFGQKMRNVRASTPVKITPAIVLLALAAIVLLIIFSTSFIVVDQTERAVITTFGKFTGSRSRAWYSNGPSGYRGPTMSRPRSCRPSNSVSAPIRRA